MKQVTRYSILLSILILLSTSIRAQDEQLVNGKGTKLGSRSAFLSKCHDTWNKTPEFSFIDRERFCECAIPILLSTEAIASTTNPKILEHVDLAILIGGRETAFEEILACSGMEMGMVRLSTIGPDGVAHMRSECSAQLATEATIQNAGISAQVLCDCLIDEVLSRDLTIGDIYAAMDPNSPLFNEVFLPCAENSTKKDFDSISSSEDIAGPVGTTTVPVIQYSNVHKVKVRLGDTEQYFIIDSGAEVCIVSKKFAVQLEQAGLIDRTTTLPDRDYMLANGTSVTCQRFVVNGFQIGPLRIDRVLVASMDHDIQYLLGKSLLQKFKTWRIDESAKTISFERY